MGLASIESHKEFEERRKTFDVEFEKTKKNIEQGKKDIEKKMKGFDITFDSEIEDIKEDIIKDIEKKFKGSSETFDREIENSGKTYDREFETPATTFRKEREINLFSYIPFAFAGFGVIMLFAILFSKPKKGSKMTTNSDKMGEEKKIITNLECPNCGAKAQGGDISPDGFAKCQYCNQWFNTK